MQSVSAALESAIEARERVVRHNVTVDWDNDGVTDISDIDDMSHKISQITVDQSLESSLPEQVRSVPGAAVAELNMTLERGNTFRSEIDAAYRGISTASSGATTSQFVTIAKPTGLLPGELVLLAIITINASNADTLLLGANVDWATIGIRGDGLDFTNRCEGQCYVRRAEAGEPSTYTFALSSAQAWIAVAVRIGDAGLMGVHAVGTKGRDDDTTAYPILSGPPITTLIPGCTIVGIYGANSPVTGASWSPLDGDTERADIITTNAGDKCTAAVMTIDDVAAGTYIKRATLSVGSQVTSAVQFTVAFAPKLAGDEAQHAAWTFSELNSSSPYAGKDRFGRRTQWNVGFHGEDGLEQVQVFTGLSIAGGGTSRSREATITALDNRETLRNVYGFFFPLIAESPLSFDSFNTPELPFYPGLETTHIISYELAYAFAGRGGSFGTYTPERQGPLGGYGYFASPPPRVGHSNCLWAPIHGSMLPFEGSPTWAYTEEANGTRRRVRFRVGPYVAGTEPAPISGLTEAAWAALGTSAHVFTTTKQIQGRIELWARLDNNSGVLYVEAVNDLGTVTQRVRLTITAGGTATATLLMPGGITRTVVGPAVPTDGEWHFYGVHIDSPSGTAVFRIDDTSTTVSFTTWSNAANTVTTIFYAHYNGVDGAQLSELQIHGGAVGASAFSTQVVIPVTSATRWLNQDFTPSAYVDKTENELDAFPFIDPGVDTWGILSSIAETEFAAIYFDGRGIPHYRNTRSDVNTVGQTVQKLITARQNLKDLAYSSEISQIANVVSVSYMPHEVFVEQIAWRAQGTIRIPPLGEYTLTIQMPGIVFAIAGFNAFTGNTAADGSGLVVSSASLSWGTNSFGLYGIQFTITNGTPQDVYLVDTSGQPTPQLTASWVAPSDSSISPVTVVDADSVRRYREQPLTVPATVWRQRVESAGMWAQFLTSELGTPSPVIHNVPIVGDPRIELGDLETLQDVNGLGVDGLYRVTAIKHQGSPSGGYSQSLTVRQAGVVALWNINNWDDGSVWGV